MGSGGLGAGTTPACAQQLGLDVAQGQQEETGAIPSARIPNLKHISKPCSGVRPWILAQGPVPGHGELARAGSSSAGAQPRWQSPPPASLGSLIAAHADLWPFSLLSNLSKELDYNLELFQPRAGDCHSPRPQKRPGGSGGTPCPNRAGFPASVPRIPPWGGNASIPLVGVAVPQFPP